MGTSWDVRVCLVGTTWFQERPVVWTLIASVQVVMVSISGD